MTSLFRKWTPPLLPLLTSEKNTRKRELKKSLWWNNQEWLQQKILCSSRIKSFIVKTDWENTFSGHLSYVIKENMSASLVSLIISHLSQNINWVTNIFGWLWKDRTSNLKNLCEFMNYEFMLNWLSFLSLSLWHHEAVWLHNVMWLLNVSLCCWRITSV